MNTNHCPSQTNTLLVKVSIKEDEEERWSRSGCAQHDDDSDASAENCEFNGCIRILALTDLTPNYDRAYLGVVSTS